MLYPYRKLLLIIVAILVIIGGGIGVYSYMHQTADDTTNTQDEKQNAIDGIDTEPLSADVKSAITRYARGTLTALYGENTYKIVVRDNSYHRSVSSEGNVTLEILLDVPEKKSTYSYTQVNSGINPKYGTSYLRCAPDDKQLVSPSQCEDVAND